MNRTIYNTTESWGSYSESSVKTPSFLKLRKLGSRLPINNYSWYRIDGLSPLSLTYNGWKTERNVRGVGTLRDAVFNGYVGTLGLAYAPCASIGEAENLTTNQLLSKVRNLEVDLGVALGEYRETAEFISSAMKKTVKSYSSLRKGDVSGALRILTGRKNDRWRDIPGVASNTWLAYSYGLRPLLKDVYDASAALEKRLQAPPELIQVRSGRDLPIAARSAYSYYADAVRGNISSRGSIRFRVSNPILKKLDQCGVLNPLSIVWELTPFSFVADWFLPIGAFITNILPPQGVDFVDGWVSTRVRGQYTSTTDIPTGWHTRSVSTEVLKRRTVLTSFPRYHVVVPDLSLSKTQVASALSLLWQHAYGEPLKGNTLRV